MSAGLPRGAPLSAHFAIVAISSSLSEGSCLNFWMPMFFSTKNVLVGDERHRRDPLGVMAFLAAALEDRRNLLREGDVGRTARRLRARRRPGQQEAARRRRCHDAQSEVHENSSLETLLLAPAIVNAVLIDVGAAF
jgi:hypothetical protein